MKTGSDRKYTAEFRDAAVRQVLDGGRGQADVARALEMSSKTLANWMTLARKGRALIKRQPARPLSELEAELQPPEAGECAAQERERNPKKAAAYFAKESM